MFTSIKKKLLSNEWAYDTFWQYQFNKSYSFDWKNASPQKLRIILGLGRSGTTWIANTLARTQTPARYFEEPLYHVRPKLQFSQQHDHTAISYKSSLTPGHRFKTAYSTLTCPDLPDDFLLNRFYKRKDKNFQVVLVKEVHSLLATEAILKTFSCPILIVLRDPVRVLDSLFNAQSLNTSYLINEYQYIQQEPFLNTYLSSQMQSYQELFERVEKEKDLRRRITGQKYLTMVLIQQMFRSIAERNLNVLLIDYEDMISSPDKNYNEISDFFDIRYKLGDYNFNAKNKTEVQNPYSLARDTSSQTEKPLKFLQTEDLDFLKGISLLSKDTQI